MFINYITESGDVIRQMNWRCIIFTTFLILAAWQDLHRKSVSLWLYAGYGAAGVIRFMGEGLKPANLSGLVVGLVLLAAGRAAGGAIGSGDGWFFVVSGLYLSLVENVRLLLNGVLLGGLFCLLLLLYGRMKGKRMKGKTVPFLPFLVPAWIWMVIT